MITAPALAGCAVAAGFVVAFLLGRKGPTGMLATLGLLLADVFVGVALTFNLSIVLAGCIQITFCAQTTDTTVWSVAYPLITIPGFWVATLVGKLSRSAPEYGPEIARSESVESRTSD